MRQLKMKVFLLSDKDSFHYDYDGRRTFLKALFPEKVPQMVSFKYGTYFNENSNLLAEFVPKRDTIYLRSSDGKFQFMVCSDEALRQQQKRYKTIGDAQSLEYIEQIKSRLAENRGQIVADAIRQDDDSDRTTYEIIKDLAIQKGWYTYTE